MRKTWRWFGPIDRVSVSDALQAGAEGIVSALHHIPVGVAWSVDEIRKRQQETQAAGLAWEVVESIPVSEAIKSGGSEARTHIAAWQETLENLGQCGIQTVCYNFMPALDWTRTALHSKRPNGARAMSFDLIDFATFDLFVLRRPEAEKDYSADVIVEAEARSALLNDEDSTSAALSSAITSGLPGDASANSLADLRRHFTTYQDTVAETLRGRLIDFLSEVVPTAERLGMRLCCHPDDPPWPLLGLPRVMSTEADYRAVLDAVDSPVNGMTLCTGSLGTRSDNDIVSMIKSFGPRIHFVHLRNVHRLSENIPCSFFEDEHLDGHTDMVSVVAALLREEKQRKESGRSDHTIPMRPDHGQDILNDTERNAQPGYPAIGRLKGLAELRGIERALSHSF